MDNVSFLKYGMSLNPKDWRAFWGLIKALNKADKVILHGLNEGLTIFILYLMPWVLKKCYWFSWGADVYKYQSEKLGLKLKILFFFKRRVVKNLGGVVVKISGEFENIQNWFGTKAKRYDSFKYPSNIFKEITVPEPDTIEGLTILVGNSANPTNNHEEALRKIFKSRKPGEKLTIYCPLSYGGPEHYVEEIRSLGKELFGDDFVPLTEFMKKDEYLELLSGTDIVVFNHRRQQGMGNLITLLGLGKKVYIRNETTPWEFFKEIGVEVFNFEELDFSLFAPQVAAKNSELIKKNFSALKLKEELQEIFEA